MNRRDFLMQSGATYAAAMTLGTMAAPEVVQAAEDPFAPGVVHAAEDPFYFKGFKKAVKFGMVKGGSLLEKFELVKACGFDGIDMDGAPQSHEEVLKARDATGLTVHGVVNHLHWSQPLSHPDPMVRENGLNSLLQAIKDVKAYGGTTVLLVPAVVNKGTSYAAAYKRSQEEIKKALPLAGELGITIAFENVWNMFLLSPLEFARYIDEFESPLVGAYFDVGNIVNYGWPEHWIQTLGKRIKKLDVKEYSRGMRDKEGPGAGFRAKIGDGDCDWPAVIKALHEVGIDGCWATAEVGGGGQEVLTDISQRMDKVLEIKK